MRDIDIRTELHKNHLSSFQYDSNTKVIDEMGVAQGAVKIDVAVINGSLIGYEIKSEQDTLVRLPEQIRLYSKVFDFLNVVVNESHLEKVKTLIPEYWGILCVEKFENGFKLNVHKQASRNPDSESYYVVQLLWKDEALDILNKLGLAAGMRSKPRKQIWEKLSNSLTKDEINRYVREYLKARTNWR